MIEFLYWEGCPSHAEALELLREVLATRGRDDEIELREVSSQADAEALRFRARRRSASRSATSTRTARPPGPR